MYKGKKACHPPESHEEIIVAIKDEKTFRYLLPTNLTEIYSQTNSTLDLTSISDTISRANELLKPYELMTSKNNRALWLCFLIGLAFMLFVSIILGVEVNSILSIAIALVYIFCMGYFLYRVKQTREVLQLKKFFNLALFLKNENNKLYHNHKVTLRPGFLGKWIEFHFRTETSSLREIEF